MNVAAEVRPAFLKCHRIVNEVFVTLTLFALHSAVKIKFVVMSLSVQLRESPAR